ncbi:M36 family metallopeptidase [Fictibacillus iocasae]|uniref:M36 family metallopeptidase n=1 Tax=Fictibacillus iocasae TaxID=2715437 RepID=A0ABW2NL89_9BACL
MTLALPTFSGGTPDYTPRTVQAQSFDAKVKADEYLKKNAAQYNLNADLSGLTYVTTIEANAGTYVRYQQTVKDKPVFTNQVTVTLDRNGKALMAVSDYTSYSKVEEPKQNITKSEAESKAAQHLNAQAGRWSQTENVFGYSIENGTAIPVYKITLHADEPFGAWEMYVHAGTGKVLKKKDLNQKVTGSGQVFLPNPIESQGSKTGLTDGNDADSAALTAQLKPVSLQGLNGTGKLEGQYVNIYSKSRTTSASHVFNYTRSDDRFEDVMVYYHIDTLQRYIQSLGFSNINNRSIKANVNTYRQDNSFYSPSTKELTFGIGGVDDAEDSGIIAHEYGHSIQDNQVPGWGNSAEGGAMGEGFGDFLGATYEDAAAPGAFGTACVGEWDAASYSSSNPPCLRRLDKNKVYPRDVVNQVHSDGEIWSQGLYDLAGALGRDTATKLVLQSHWSLTPNATFNNGAKAIKQADQLLNAGRNATAIDSIFAARGLSTN